MSDTEDGKSKVRWYVLWDEKLRRRVAEWYEGLHKSKGNRATLRRCASPAEAALISVTFSLRKILPKNTSFEAVATVAGILAHVSDERSADTYSFGKRLALPRGGGDSPLFSETRFRQLLSARGWSEWYTGLRRAVMMLKGNVNPLEMADIILKWDRERRDDLQIELKNSVKFDLANDYYNAIK